ncbi:MAG: sortase A [Paraglaciecola sp.]|jgi:sortase A
MYAIVYQKKTLSGRISQLSYKELCLLVLLALGIFQFGSGMYIFAKAHLAQYLIAIAWDDTLAHKTQQKPWAWADTYPVAKLSLAEQTLYVLAGSSGRTLAFAPGHMSATSLPGETGNSVIVGHRDSHFRILKDLQKGDIIKVQTSQGQKEYRVSTLRIAHQSQVHLVQQSEHNLLTLITCYPFDSLLPKPELRYVVRAQRIGTHIIET